MFASANKKPLPSLRGNAVSLILTSRLTPAGVVIDVVGTVQPLVANADGTNPEAVGPTIPVAPSVDAATATLIAGLKEHAQNYLNAKGL